MSSTRQPDLFENDGRKAVNGAEILSGYLGVERQKELVSLLRNITEQAPLFSPRTRFGKSMSVRMTSAGKYGWYSDGRGYRYEARHPSGADWPEIPTEILRIWREVTKLPRDPDCCLINYYGEGARMGLHQDRDEASFDWPVLSVSLGDDALFRIGGADRGDPTRSIWLRSGDVLILGGTARLAFHGVDRIRYGSSSLLPGGGRINLTLRVVD